MGVPLQEKWIYRNRELLEPKVCVGVGAFLDYLSGILPRASIVVRRLNLEWLWRVFIDPKRMIKRYFFDGLRLMIVVLTKRIQIIFK